MRLEVKKVEKDATLPTRAHSSDAGMDFYALMRYDIQPGERVQIRTGIALAIPEGYVGLIWDKSGLSHKVGLKVLGGVIDAGYRGEIMIGIINLGEHAYRLERGHKIAQLLIQEVVLPDIVEVRALDEDTERGDGAFGSSGV